MKNLGLLAICMMFVSGLYSQGHYKPGYIINLENEKINCLVNTKQIKTPTQIEYKIEDKSDIKIATVDQVLGYGIGDKVKYVTEVVNIDRSRIKATDIDDIKEPIYSTERLFIKVLVEGASNLYQYRENGLVKYFISTPEGVTEELIHKKYYADKQIRINSDYKKQLATLLPTNKDPKSFQKIKYTPADLKSYVAAFSRSQNVDPIIYSASNFGKVRLALRPRTSYNSFSRKNNVEGIIKEYKYDNPLNYGLGVYVEYLIPFLNNNWAIFIEPTYQNYNSEGEEYVYSDITLVTLKDNIEYASIELPIGIRRYQSIHEKTRLFAGAAVIYDFPIYTSSFTATRVDNGEIFGVEPQVKNSINLGFEIGAELMNTYSISVKYHTDRNMLQEWEANFSNVSLIFGINLF